MENSFGSFLKQKRQEKNLTQKELAKLLFVSESAVSKWEKDIAHPDITMLPKLSELLGVTEHELITASVDNKSKVEKAQAKKWRALSMTWSMFFYIAYGVALIPCFICNLAISKTLSWFWIVLFALVLSFTFTNLPKLVKKHKLLILPASMYFALCLLLGTCCIYTKGDWFLLAAFSTLLGLLIIFTPIYIAKYNIFEKVRKYNDFISFAVYFVLINILLIIVDVYCVINGYAQNHWYLSLALPIVIFVYLFLNLILSVRFIKTNKLLKTSIILFLIDMLYFIPPFVKFKNVELQREIEEANVFKANFSNWSTEISLENNINCIFFLTMLAVASAFLIAGLIKHFANKKKLKKI